MPKRNESLGPSFDKGEERGGADGTSVFVTEYFFWGGADGSAIWGSPGAGGGGGGFGGPTGGGGVLGAGLSEDQQWLAIWTNFLKSSPPPPLP